MVRRPRVITVISAITAAAAIAMLAACGPGDGVSVIGSSSLTTTSTTTNTTTNTTASNDDGTTSTTVTDATSTTTTVAVGDAGVGIEFRSCDDFVGPFDEAPDDRWECGRLTVPVDHDDPEGPTAQLAVTRREGSRSRGEVLVVNPGGPGGAGLAHIWQTADLFPADVTRWFDIVSWDPRGVGQSVPSIECPARSRWSDDDLIGRCATLTGDVMAHMSTPNHVRDLDALRAALANERLNFVGYSYGSFLGAHYALEYPERTGRLVLDGAVDPDAGTAAAPADRGRAWYAADDLPAVQERFFELCDAASACELGPDSETRFDELRDTVSGLPTEGHPGTGDVPVWTLDAVAESAMYDPFSWGVVATAYEDALQGDASTLQGLAYLFEVADEFYGNDVNHLYDNGALANTAIYCADFQSAQPDGCVGLPVNESPPTIAAVELDDPILVVGTAFDPSTPGRHAEELADRLGDATTLMWDGIGHTAFGGNSLCIDDAVALYLIDGISPDADASCPFVDGYVDDAALADYLFSLPPTWIEGWIADVLTEAWGDDAACGARQLSVLGDQLVSQIVLGVSNDVVDAAIDDAAAACSSG